MSRDWAESDFVRIYHSIKTDEKLKAVYGDKALLGWYVTLLLEAHSAFPTPAFVPRSIPDETLTRLAELEVIALDGDSYTVCGLSKERAEVIGRQGGMIRAATAERDEGGRFVAGIPVPIPDNADGRDDIEAFVEVYRRAPSPRQRQLLDDIQARHDPKWSAGIMLANPSDAIGALLDADRNRRKGKTKPPGIRSPLLQEIAKAMSERYPERNDSIDVSRQTGVESVA